MGLIEQRTEQAEQADNLEPSELADWFAAINEEIASLTAAKATAARVYAEAHESVSGPIEFDLGGGCVLTVRRGHRKGDKWDNARIWERMPELVTQQCQVDGRDPEVVAIEMVKAVFTTPSSKAPSMRGLRTFGENPDDYLIPGEWVDRPKIEILDETQTKARAAAIEAKKAAA